MHNRKPVYFRLWITLSVVLSSLFVALFGSQLVDSLAQISVVPTPTFTATASQPTPTDTPIPPTPTDTPVLPTNTPAAPTNTPTPFPDPPQGSAIEIDPPEALAAVGTVLDYTWAFTDPGASFAFVTWDYGDGTSSSCPPDSAECTVDWPVSADGTSSGSQLVVGTANSSHAYNDPGIYTVQVTAYDAYGQLDASVFEYVVVYDPDGGFVTGGGWIDSQPGAYRPDPTLAGKATFGFVSKYKAGATAPTGRTSFQFKAGDLSFHADSYDWLVVNRGGTYAQFKGTGTINGAPDPNDNGYRFMLWAEDGMPDTFRMRIWWEEGTGEIVVYDNGFSQPIGGGSIHIQR